MKMKKYIIAAAAFCLVAIADASAQNIDPVVEVTRDYDGSLMEVHKPVMKMEVPDSAMHFDMIVDYSVSDNPYKGTDFFNPYYVEMKPSSAPVQSGKFFLRAGAGYSLHPVADIVWTPNFKGPFSMSVYGSHRSFLGRYRSIFAVRENTSDRFIRLKNSGSVYKGYDAHTSAGVQGRMAWNKAYLSFDAGYRGTARKDTTYAGSYDALRAEIRFASTNPFERHFFYDVRAAYSYGKDKLSYSVGARKDLTEHDLDISATLGPVFSKLHKALLDVDLEMAAYRGVFNSYSGNFSLVPKYVFRKGRWQLDLGVKLSLLFPGRSVSGADAEKGQFIYPAFKAEYEAIKNYMNIYLRADGGNDINRYSTLVESRKHFHADCLSVGSSPLIDNSVERVRALLGIAGNIASRFDYDLRTGFAVRYNALMDAAIFSNATGLFAPAVGYADYNEFFVALDCSWHSEHMDVIGAFSCRNTNLVKHHSNVIEPAAFSGELDFVYNWRKRVYAGLHCDGSVSRKGWCASNDASAQQVDPKQVIVPGFVDLGISLEYRFNKKFSFWVYGGNLLNMTIQRIPMYAQSGISCTAGICLEL